MQVMRSLWARVLGFIKRINGVSSPLGGVSWDNSTSASALIPRHRVRQFKRFTYELTQWMEDTQRSFDPQLRDKRRVLAWADGIDDELLAVFSEFIRMCDGTRSIRGVTRDSISLVAQPLGLGRSVEALIDALLSVGVLAPSTELVREGTYSALDAKANPSYDFGRMYYAVRPYVAAFDALPEGSDW